MAPQKDNPKRGGRRNRSRNRVPAGKDEAPPSPAPQVQVARAASSGASQAGKPPDPNRGKDPSPEPVPVARMEPPEPIDDVTIGPTTGEDPAPEPARSAPVAVAAMVPPGGRADTGEDAEDDGGTAAANPAPGPAATSSHEAGAGVGAEPAARRIVTAPVPPGVTTRVVHAGASPRKQRARPWVFFALGLVTGAAAAAAAVRFTPLGQLLTGP